MDGVERVDEDIWKNGTQVCYVYGFVFASLASAHDLFFLHVSLYWGCVLPWSHCCRLVLFCTTRSERSLPEFDTLTHPWTKFSVTWAWSFVKCQILSVKLIETCQCVMHVWFYVAWTLEFDLLPVQPCAHTDVPRLRIEETNLSEFSIFKWVPTSCSRIWLNMQWPFSPMFFTQSDSKYSSENWNYSSYNGKKNENQKKNKKGNACASV